MATKKKNTKHKAKLKASNHAHAREIHSGAEAVCLAVYDLLDCAVAFSDDVDEAPKKADLVKLKKSLVAVNKALVPVASAIEKLSA